MQPITVAPAARFTGRLIAHTTTHIGHRRRVQADAHTMLTKRGTLAVTVADGAGDDPDAAEAAEYAAHEITVHAATVTDPGRQLYAAILAARTQMEWWHWNGPYDGWIDKTAAIVTAAITPTGHTAVGWLGDARAYRVGRTGMVTRLTTDHNPTEPWPGLWDDTARERASHTLERHMGAGAPGIAAPADGWWRLILCSDGLNKYLDDTGISDIVNTAPTAADASAWLVDAALATGGRDNVTVTVVEDPARSLFPAASAA